jgi:acetyl esterase/lipase
MADDLKHVDPELVPALQTFPPFQLSNEILPAVRQGFTEMTRANPLAASAEAAAEAKTVKAPDGFDVPIFIHKPKAPASGKRAGLLFIHGGGYIFGDAFMSGPSCRAFADAADIVVVAVDYRLAPDYPHPVPVEDCYAALQWLFDNADALGVDVTRIGVAGESAGGGLSASLALLARDRGKLKLAYQQLIYPMIDDRTCTRTDVPAHLGQFVWTRDANVFGWTSLLGKAPGGADVSPYAAAARATDLSGLPPAFIYVGALDLFLDEDLDYAQRLLAAGVPTELHVYDGAYHGFEVAVDSNVAQRAFRDRIDSLRRGLAKK